jgi:hypothetical protein
MYDRPQVAQIPSLACSISSFGPIYSGEVQSAKTNGLGQVSSVLPALKAWYVRPFSDYTISPAIPMSRERERVLPSIYSKMLSRSDIVELLHLFS